MEKGKERRHPIAFCRLALSPFNHSQHFTDSTLSWPTLTPASTRVLPTPRPPLSPAARRPKNRGTAMMLAAASRVALRRPLLRASAPLAAVTTTSLARFLATKPSKPLPAAADRQPIATPPTAPASSPAPPLEPTPVASPPPPTEPYTPFENVAEPPAPGSDMTRATSLAEQYLDLSDVAPPSSEAFGSSTGAKAKGSGSKSSIEKKRQNMSRFFGLVGVGGLLAGGAYLGRDWDDEFEKMKLVGRTEDLKSVEDCEKGGWEAWKARTMLRGADMLDVSCFCWPGVLGSKSWTLTLLLASGQYLNKPAWDPLLPPPLPEPHYKHYTLVIDLDDLLIHSVWDVSLHAQIHSFALAKSELPPQIDHGWRTAKRPGVDYFLAYMSLFYEIVLFTTQPAYVSLSRLPRRARGPDHAFATHRPRCRSSRRLTRTAPTSPGSCTASRPVTRTRRSSRCVYPASGFRPHTNPSSRVAGPVLPRSAARAYHHPRHAAVALSATARERNRDDTVGGLAQRPRREGARRAHPVPRSARDQARAGRAPSHQVLRWPAYSLGLRGGRGRDEAQGRRGVGAQQGEDQRHRRRHLERRAGFARQGTFRLECGSFSQ